MTYTKTCAALALLSVAAMAVTATVPSHAQTITDPAALTAGLDGKALKRVEKAIALINSPSCQQMARPMQARAVSYSYPEILVQRCKAAARVLMEAQAER